MIFTNAGMIAASIWTKLGDIFAGFFAIIPQIMYFLYTSIASVLDMFQYIFRKLAGLDSYYFNGDTKTGDVVIDFIEGILGINKEYSALNTVFWSMIIFGVIVLILMTILTFIKSHYNYDATKSSPNYIIKNCAKSVFTMAIVPLVTLFGLYLCQALFKVIDSFTAQTSSDNLASTFEVDACSEFSFGEGDNGAKYYSSYDFFGEREWANTTTFSGVMFNVCANQANRVRYGAYTPNGTGWDNANVFYTSKTENVQETIANQIDYAFKNSLTFTTSRTITFAGLDEASAAIGLTLTYGPSATFASGLINVKTFSKYNVGLVWYYYNLWSFNFLLGFVAIVVCVSLFSNILFGLIMRIIFSAILFLAYPPIVGLGPFDEGNAYKSWKKSFMSYLISGYATIIAMNLLFLILPFFYSVDFFNISLIDGIVHLLIMLAGLSMVKRFISMLSSFVGAKDIQELGANAKKSASEPMFKAVGATAGLAGAAVGTMRLGQKGFSATMKKGGEIASKISKSEKVQKFKNKINSSKLGVAVEKGSAAISDALKKAGDKINSSKIGVAVEKGSTAVSNAIKKAGGAAILKAKKAGEALKKAVKTKPMKFIGAVLGIPVDPHDEEDYEDWVNPENGQTEQVLKLSDKEKAEGKTKRVKRQSGGAIIKKHFVDISKVAFKGVGTVLGFKNAFEKLRDSSKGVDILKSDLNDLTSELNAFGKKPAFQTMKMKKDAEKEEKKNQTIPMIDMDVSTSRQTLDKIQEIAKEISAHPDDYL